MTELVEVSRLSRWLTRARRPFAARNDVSASPTGRTAASSAPKATRRIPTARGTAVHSARVKSLRIVSLNHLLADPSPNSSIRSSGWAARVSATVSRIGWTRSAAVIGSPDIASRISTE